VLREFGEQKFIGVSATRSWEKSRNFRYGSYFFSKFQKTVGGVNSITPPPPPPGPERVTNTLEQFYLFEYANNSDSPNIPQK